MEIKAGDWVQTDTGEIGQVVHAYQLSAFVRLNPESEAVKSFLMSQLKRIDRPQHTNGPSRQRPQ